MLEGRYLQGLVATPTNTVFASGGVSNIGGSLSSTPTCELYDVARDTWTRVHDMAVARRGHGSALLPDGRIMIAGGHNATYLASVEIYSVVLDKWVSGPSLSTARMFVQLVTLSSGKVVAGPGLEGGGRPVANVVELYDPTTETWELLEPIPVATYGYGMSLLANDVVLVAGGRVNNVNSVSKSNSSLGSDEQTNVYTLALGSPPSFRCLQDSCVAVPPGRGGVSKPACEAACGAPISEYICVGGRCVPHAGGVAKETCERICRPVDDPPMLQ
jgi:hypothetical protein